MLLPEEKANPNALARFTREARAAATIRGEHVARVLDVGELDGGMPYIVMEYLEGRDLAQTLADRGPLPPDQAAAYVLQACEAIAEAHAAGIVHRDLKPSNLFITRRPDGTPLIKVLDFGISKALLSAGGEGKLTTTSSFVGSPIYSPPEQLVRSHDVDARADIWALGTILFESLAGRPPFVGDSVMHVASRIFNEQPASLAELRPELPAELCAVVMRCLRKRPEDRFQDVRALAAALAPFAPAHSISAERIARIVAAAAADPTSKDVALADTAHASGETPHALVSARTPPTSAPRRRAVVGAVVLGALVAGIAIVLGVGRAPAARNGRPAGSVDPAPGVGLTSVGAAAVAPAAAPTESVRVETGPAPSSPAASSSAPPAASSSAPAQTAPARPAAGVPKRNPLAVDVK
jgi:serine/threonine-protein kinase